MVVKVHRSNIHTVRIDTHKRECIFLIPRIFDTLDRTDSVRRRATDTPPLEMMTMSILFVLSAHRLSSINHPLENSEFIQKLNTYTESDINATNVFVLLSHVFCSTHNI